MGLTTNDSTGFYFESKIIERSLEIKNNMLFNFQELFQKCTFLILCHFFSYLVLVQSTQFLSDNTNLEDSCLWWSIFPVNYQNPNGDQTCQGGDILRGSSTYKFARHINELVLWGHVTKKTYIYWQKTYEHQTTQSADLFWGAPTLKNTKSFDHVTNMTLYQHMWPLKLVHGGASQRKRLSRHRLIVLLFSNFKKRQSIFKVENFRQRNGSTSSY